MYKGRPFVKDLRSNIANFRESSIALNSSQTMASIGMAKLTSIFGNRSNPTQSTTMVTSASGQKCGRICMICDRKFILYEYYSDFACQVEELDG